MFGAILFLNSRGDLVVSRRYREGFEVRSLSETFRDEFVSSHRMDRSPINAIGTMCFMHIKVSDVYLVMVADMDCNCVACFQYGARLLQMIFSYAKRIDENVLKTFFVAIGEMMDETSDFGYPQFTEPAAMMSFISPSGPDSYIIRNSVAATFSADKTLGSVPWRAAGLVYRVNEVFVDVHEEICMLLSSNASVLASEVMGKVVMKNFLSGVPTCELVLNSQLFNSSTIVTNAWDDEVGHENQLSLHEVAVHPCVDLGVSETTQHIHCVPPDGDFTVLRYRTTFRQDPPLHISDPTVAGISKTRMELQFVLKCDASLLDVELAVPCPENTAAATVNVGRGHGEYSASEHAIQWKVGQVKQGDEIAFFAEVKQIARTSETTEQLWSRPPVSVKFRCASPSFTGFRIERMNVLEPQMLYTPNKWIKYSACAGQYQCRI